MMRAVAAALLATVAVAFAVAAASVGRRRRLLERLDVPARSSSERRPQTWVLLGTGAVAAWLVGERLAGLAGSLAFAAGVFAIPPYTRRRRARRWERVVEERMAEAVSVLASAMRSGRSLHQATEVAAAELDPPLGPAFRELADRAGMGDRLDDAIDDWALKLGGADARLAAGILHLHRRTGGALAAALDQLSATLRARRRAARELHALTAQARLSATILGLLPLGFFVFMSLVARQDLVTASSTPLGVSAIVLGLTMQAAAYLWIRRLLRVEP